MPLLSTSSLILQHSVRCCRLTAALGVRGMTSTACLCSQQADILNVDGSGARGIYVSNLGLESRRKESIGPGEQGRVK